MTNTKELVIQDMFDMIEIKGRNLSKWEEDFINSIKEQFEKRRTLSEKQEDVLRGIYEDKT